MTTTLADTLGASDPRVLALDLSLTATGVACPDGDLDTIHPHGDGDWRLVVIRNRVADLLAELTPTLVVLEGHVVRSGAASTLGMLHGVVRVLLMDADIPYLTVSPATLKVYATGRGTAPKPDLRVELLKRTGLDIRDDNQVDAAWLRLLALDLTGHPEISLPQTHRRALTKLAAPPQLAVTR